MISIDSEQKLPSVAVSYITTRGVLVGLILAVLGFWITTLGTISGTQTINGVSTPATVAAFWPGIVLVALGILLPLYQILYISMFSFVISNQNITVNSGILFRQSKTTDFNKVQNVTNTRGPLAMIFGVTVVNIWTASQDQLQMSTSYVNGMHRTSVTARPEAKLYLAQADAIELKNLISGKGAVQDVNIVSQNPA